MENRPLAEVTEEEEYFLLCKKESAVAITLPTLKADGPEKEYIQTLLKKSISKYATSEDQQPRMDSLGVKLCTGASKSDVVERGREKCAQRLLDGIRNEIELLSFSIHQRKICIGKLAGTVVYSFVSLKVNSYFFFK